MTSFTDYNIRITDSTSRSDQVVELYLKLLTKYSIQPKNVLILSSFQSDILFTELLYSEEDFAMIIFQYAATETLHKYRIEESWKIPGKFRTDHKTSFTDSDIENIDNIFMAEKIFDSLFSNAQKFFTKNKIDPKFFMRYMALSFGSPYPYSFKKILPFRNLWYCDNETLLPYLTDSFNLGEIQHLQNYSNLPVQDYAKWKDAPEEWLEEMFNKEHQNEQL